MPAISFSGDKETKIAVLKSFGFTVDDSGKIFDDESKCEAKTPEGLSVRLDNFAGIWPGSRIIIKEDVNSLLNLTKK